MASSRRVPVNDQVDDYGAPTDPYDAGELGVWEAATDIGLVGLAEGRSLRITTAQASYDDNIPVIGGATVNASYFRRIFAAQADAPLGLAADGIALNANGVNNPWASIEAYLAMQDLVLTASGSRASTAYWNLAAGSDMMDIVGCIMHGITESRAVVQYDQNNAAHKCLTANSLFYDNIVAGNSDSILLNFDISVPYIYSCTVVDNSCGTSGPISGNAKVVTNAIVAHNTTDIIGGSTTELTNFKGIAVTFLNRGADDYRLDNTSANGVDDGTSLAADGSFPFTDDCAFTERPIGAGWDIGFNEAPAAVGGLIQRPNMDGGFQELRGGMI